MNETTDATAIFAPIWRRKWLILAVGIVVGVASYLYYKRQPPIYQASTQVYLGVGSEEQALGEKTASKGKGASVSNQATLINTIVVEEVQVKLHKEHKAGLVRKTKVRARAPEKSEFIAISAEGRTAKGTALLANLTAQAYVRRVNAQHRRSIERAIAISRRQLHRIEAASTVKTGKSTKHKGSSSSSPEVSAPSTSSIIQTANISSKINQLEASLGTVSVQQLKPAKANTATLFSPKPKQDAIFGFVIGIVLAAIAAYAFSRFDRRLRSLAGAEEVFRAPILAALPKVGRPIVSREGTPRPSAALIEPLQRLHTALALVPAPALPTPGRQPHVPVSSTSAAPALEGLAHESHLPESEDSERAGRVILFVSPDPGDGKSTVLANLALVQRDAGEQVVVVEANFRRPVQARLLGLESAHGLSEILARGLPAEEAMQRVMPHLPSPADHPSEAGEGLATAVHAPAGSLFVLAGGGSVSNPPALLAQPAMTKLLRSLAEEFNYVLIDAPSPLEVSDALSLFGVVDAVVVVTRTGHTREASAQRLRQLLDRPSNAPVIGVAVNCVARPDLKRYGFSSPNGRAWPGKLVGR